MALWCAEQNDEILEIETVILQAFFFSFGSKYVFSLKFFIKQKQLVYVT